MSILVLFSRKNSENPYNKVHSSYIYTDGSHSLQWASDAMLNFFKPVQM